MYSISTKTILVFFKTDEFFLMQCFLRHAIPTFQVLKVFLGSLENQNGDTPMK